MLFLKQWPFQSSKFLQLAIVVRNYRNTNSKSDVNASKSGYMCVFVEFIDFDISHDIANGFHLSWMDKDSCVYCRISGAGSAYPSRTIRSTFL